jgi:hypothetical protein
LWKCLWNSGVPDLVKPRWLWGCTCQVRQVKRSRHPDERSSERETGVTLAHYIQKWNPASYLKHQWA